MKREILTSSILGFAYLAELNLEQAEAEFLHLIELDPSNSTGYASLGIVYLRMEKYNKAESQLLKAKEIDPENALIRILLSETYALTNKQDESVNELREALKWTRDFIIYSEGWVKDGDMNTATGNTVLPLPFHGMTSYPYGPDEQYPIDSVHNIYNEIYNTRKITSDLFKKMVLDYTDF